jgi:serine/threonine protein kinase
MPFKKGSKVNLAKKIEKCEYDIITGSISDEIHEIIKKCFVFDPRARPSVFEILQN